MSFRALKNQMLLENFGPDVKNMKLLKKKWWNECSSWTTNQNSSDNRLKSSISDNLTFSIAKHENCSAVWTISLRNLPFFNYEIQRCDTSLLAFNRKPGVFSTLRKFITTWLIPSSIPSSSWRNQINKSQLNRPSWNNFPIYSFKCSVQKNRINKLYFSVAISRF